MNLLESLAEHLRGRDQKMDGEARPAAILWTDPKGEWQPLIPALAQKMDELLVLGDFDPAIRQGPAIWLRCIIDRTLDEPKIPQGRCPIIYLPHVSRQDLQAGEGCMEEVQPLVELLFRGTLWKQANGSDWTLNAYLTSNRTLGLDVAGDGATADALSRALRELSLVSIQQLKGRRLEADDFDDLLAGDWVRDLLFWMGSPEETVARLGENVWAATCSKVEDKLGFQPQREGEIQAGANLGSLAKGWAPIWKRFCETPDLFPGVSDLLRRSRPGDTLAYEKSTWPDLNTEEESKVREELEQALQKPAQEAREQICGLELAHKERRKWVWAKLGECPMAMALKPLALLAAGTAKSLTGNNPEVISQRYVDFGWEVDLAALDCLAITTRDAELVKNLVRHLLKPWQEEAAISLQASIQLTPLPHADDHEPIQVQEGECLLFTDGLRYDLGQRLAGILEAQSCKVTIGNRWSALPSVTATGKAAVTAIAGRMAGNELPEDFEPVFTESGRSFSAGNLRKELSDLGHHILGQGDLDWSGSDKKGWCEYGDIDKLGHQRGIRLAEDLERELERLASRIREILSAGWKSVKVVTDHGWLLMPGGLPKSELPKHLTESKWARCAVIAAGATPDVPRSPWFWNHHEFFAHAPGISCFRKNETYTHGGVSIQECLLPVLDITSMESSEARARITSLHWTGMRCMVEVSSMVPGLSADIRLERANGRTVVTQPKAVEEGSATLLLAGDEHEDKALVVVLLDSSGSIIAQHLTRVGQST
jgi:hypothetical protein